MYNNQQKLYTLEMTQFVVLYLNAVEHDNGGMIYSNTGDSLRFAV